MKRHRLVATVALAASSILGCDAPEQTYEPEELMVSCEGKCDGLDSVKSLLRDPSELELDDLLNASVPAIVDQLNDFLSSTPLLDIELEQPAFHHAEDIDRLVSGLAARYGERELTTEVNRIRAEHLTSSQDTTYAEVAVEIDAHVTEGWSFRAEGLEGVGDITSRVGFDAGTSVEARVIGAHSFEPGDPLNNLEALRGFIVPRNLDELRQMKPGELIALRGRGRLGINIGVGVPLLVAEPTSALTYNLVLSAGLRSYLEGTLDVQMVRLDDSELVLDVGIERARIRSARIGVEDRWGLQGLVDLDVDIGSIDVDLGRLVEKALQNELNDKLDGISAYAERSSTKTRASVARFRIDLDEADPDVLGPMLRQSILGDIRLAQALANRGEPGVSAEFDFLRSGLSTTSGAGIDIFGLSFYKRRIESEGTVVVQTPGGARSLMFDSLHREGGLFVSRHGYTRVGLAGLVWDTEGMHPRTEANLFVQVQESDKGMERDKYVDHLDAIIVALGGPEVYEVIDAPANELEQYVQSLCPEADIVDPCTWESTRDPELRPRMDAALSEFQTAISDFDPSTAALLTMVARHKLLAQGTYEVKNNGFIGPGTDVFVDFRLDDSTLADLALNHDGDDLATNLETILAATDVKREQNGDAVARDRRDLVEDSRADLREMAETFDAFAADYRQLLAAETANLETIGQLGPRTMEIRFEVDRNDRPLLETAVVRSLARARSELAATLFDQLEDDADHWDPHAEQVVAYGLLSLALTDHLDLRVDIDHFLDDTFFARRKVYREADYPEHLSAYARGPATAPIDGGLFDIDALLVED